ncbi:MAG: hypothetical protein J7K82_05285 [Thermoproteales archaeon]|nr:hypothetical protein [Thermoproteales archaeon]
MITFLITCSSSTFSILEAATILLTTISTIASIKPYYAVVYEPPKTTATLRGWNGTNRVLIVSLKVRGRIFEQSDKPG